MQDIGRVNVLKKACSNSLLAAGPSTDRSRLGVPSGHKEFGTEMIGNGHLIEVVRNESEIVKSPVRISRSFLDCPSGLWTHDCVQVCLHKLFIQVDLIERPSAWWVRNDIHIIQAGDLGVPSVCSSDSDPSVS